MMYDFLLSFYPCIRTLWQEVKYCHTIPCWVLKPVFVLLLIFVSWPKGMVKGLILYLMSHLLMMQTTSETLTAPWVIKAPDDASGIGRINIQQRILEQTTLKHRKHFFKPFLNNLHNQNSYQNSALPPTTFLMKLYAQFVPYEKLLLHIQSRTWAA